MLDKGRDKCYQGEGGQQSKKRARDLKWWKVLDGVGEKGYGTSSLGLAVHILGRGRVQKNKLQGGEGEPTSFDGRGGGEGVLPLGGNIRNAVGGGIPNSQNLRGGRKKSMH